MANQKKKTSPVMKTGLVAVSGGFDPIHIGHIHLIQEAAKYGELCVLLNSDRFLMEKKGYVFMRQHQRAAILQAIKGVTHVFPVIDRDMTVCETLRLLKPSFFVNGGDRDSKKAIPEAAVCEELGIQMIFTGQPKEASSQDLCSQLLRQVSDRNISTSPKSA